MTMRTNRRTQPQSSEAVSFPKSSSQGRQRLLDVSPTGEYHPITLRLSMELQLKLKMACAIENVSQTDYIITVLQPQIEKTLRSKGLDPDTI